MKYELAVKMARRKVERLGCTVHVVYVPEFNWYDIESPADRALEVFTMEDVIVLTLEPA